MKKYIFFFSSVILGLTACEKNTGYVDPTMEAEGARVKFIHASWNAPSVMFYGKDTTLKFTAAAPTTTNILQGMAFGAVYPSLDYTLLPSYNDSVRIRVPSNSTASPNFYAGIGKINVQENNYYSVFLVDSFPQVSTLFMADTLKNFNAIPDSMYNVRFVNTIYGSPAVDLYSKRNNAVIFSSLPYKAHSRFAELRVFPTSDTLEVRLAGTTTVVARLNTFAAGVKKTYTWFARGRFGATTPTAAVPTVSFYTNQ